MSPLLLIWLVAILLSVGAVAWMTVLIILRLLHERRTARRAHDRRAVEAALIGVVQDRPDALTKLAPFIHRGRLMAEVLLEFLGLVRGDDLAKVVAALREFGVERTLRQRAFQGSREGRLAATEALGAFPGPESQFALIRAAGRGPPDARLCALRSLLQAGGEVRVERLVGHLEAGQLRASGQLSDLFRLVVEREPDAAIQQLASPKLSLPSRVALLEALGGSGAYSAIPVLNAHLDAKRPEIRAAAVHALGKLMHPAAAPSLQQALDDEAWQVRSAAAEAIGTVGLPKLAGALGAKLADPVWRVRFESASALARLGAEGVRTLKAAADGPHKAAHRTAALTLAERGLA